MYSHLANTCTTVSFHKYGWYVRAPRTSLTPPLFLIDVSLSIPGNKAVILICILVVSICLFLRFLDLILELFRQCVMFFVFIFLPLNDMRSTYVITIYKRSVHAS